MRKPIPHISINIPQQSCTVQQYHRKDNSDIIGSRISRDAQSSICPTRNECSGQNCKSHSHGHNSASRSMAVHICHLSVIGDGVVMLKDLKLFARRNADERGWRKVWVARQEVGGYTVFVSECDGFDSSRNIVVVPFSEVSSFNARIICRKTSKEAVVKSFFMPLKVDIGIGGRTTGVKHESVLVQHCTPTSIMISEIQRDPTCRRRV